MITLLRYRSMALRRLWLMWPNGWPGDCALYRAWHRARGRWLTKEPEGSTWLG